jgi:hypothetical protein
MDQGQQNEVTTVYADIAALKQELEQMFSRIRLRPCESDGAGDSGMAIKGK